MHECFSSNFSCSVFPFDFFPFLSPSLSPFFPGIYGYRIYLDATGDFSRFSRSKNTSVHGPQSSNCYTSLYICSPCRQIIIICPVENSAGLTHTAAAPFFNLSRQLFGVFNAQFSHQLETLDLQYKRF